MSAIPEPSALTVPHSELAELPAHRALVGPIAAAIGALERGETERCALAVESLCEALYAARRESLVVAARASQPAARLRAGLDAQRFAEAIEQLRAHPEGRSAFDRAELRRLLETLRSELVAD